MKKKEKDIKVIIRKFDRDVRNLVRKYNDERIWIYWAVDERPIDDTPPEAPNRRESFRFFKNIADFFYGVYYGYPLCCIWFFLRNYKNLVRINKKRRKVKYRNVNYVMCKKCYNKL